jgi:hypothetical protein
MGMKFSILVEVLSLVVIVFMQRAVQRRASEWCWVFLISRDV